MDVRCKQCGGVYHETTEQFTMERAPHGGMFRLKAQFVENGWFSFPEHVGVTGDAIECPNCGAPYGSIQGEPCNTDAQILALHEQGKKPKEIAEALGLGHHLKVSARLKALGV